MSDSTGDNKREVGFFCGSCGRGFELVTTTGDRVIPDHCPFCGERYLATEDDDE